MAAKCMYSSATHFSLRPSVSRLNACFVQSVERTVKRWEVELVAAAGVEPAPRGSPPSRLLARETILEDWEKVNSYRSSDNRGMSHSRGAMSEVGPQSLALYPT